MSKKNRHRRDRNQSDAKSRANPSTPGRNDAPGGAKNRTNGVFLLAALVLVVGIVVYALNAPKSPTAAGPAVASSTPLPTVTAPPPPPLSPPPSAPTVSSNSGPKIEFATPVHDFGQIKGGDVVKYTYFFKNVGQQPLEVTAVQASCGCTTAGEWSRKVEPGQTGSIPIEFNSGSFSGQVSKVITVTCNDASQPTVTLQLQANIWRPIDVTPQFAVLNVTSESLSNSTTVRIVNNVEEPLILSAPESSSPAFAADLKTNQPGKEFELVLRTVPPLPPGNASGQITLKTSSTNMPVINVSAWANVQPVVMLIPTQITLPVAPLANPVPATVSIRNNGTNTLALFEPAVNAKGVEVLLREVQPGRYFSVMLTFPTGFEIAPGGSVELSMKSNHPQFPNIKVPVLQPPRPAPIAAPEQVNPSSPRAGGGGR